MDILHQYIGGIMKSVERVITSILLRIFGSVAPLASSTFIRLALTLVLLPIYFVVQIVGAAPHIIANLPKLVNEHGRFRLARAAHLHRQHEKNLARHQLKGAIYFRPEELSRIPVAEKRRILKEAGWTVKWEELEVCGGKVAVYHEKPGGVDSPPRDPIVLLHGNPSWSLIWRDVIPQLVQAGHEVFAIDWLGHGLSDKPLQPSIISFELHMQTLFKFFDHYQIENAIVAAHDWGGCIALCTVPQLPISTVSRLLFLNSFFPPRSTDVSWSTRLLYLIWFFSTGIFGGYFPESLAIKYLVPSAPTSILAGYSAPFPQPHLKTSITRFAHIVPFLPDFVLENWRDSHCWKVIEGLIGPARFTNLNAQAGLAERNEVVREYWRNGVSGRFEGTGKERLQTLVAFGRDDPLSGDFKEILVRGISDEVQKIPKGVWIDGAGHYPMVEKPAVVVQIIGLLVG